MTPIAEWVGWCRLPPRGRWYEVCRAGSEREAWDLVLRHQPPQCIREKTVKPAGVRP